MPIDFERELAHLLSVHLQGSIMGKTLIEKLGKQKYLDYMWEIVEKGADCIMELRTTEEQREIKVMEGLTYLFTKWRSSDMNKEKIKDRLLKEKAIFLELIKKDQNRILYENDDYTEKSERWDKITPDKIKELNNAKTDDD